MRCYTVRGKTIWKVYDPRYMTKRRPVMPRAACLSLWDWVIGRPSPSKVLLMMVYGDPRWSRKHCRKAAEAMLWWKSTREKQTYMR